MKNMKVKENYQITKEKIAQPRIEKNYIGGTDVEITDEIVAGYVNMVHKLMQKIPCNTVCNKEDLFQEGVLSIVEGLIKYDPYKGASLNTWMYHCISDRLADFCSKNFSHLSGGKYFYRAVKKWQAANDTFELPTIKQLQETGVSAKTATALEYYWKQPSMYGPQLNMVDRETKKRFSEVEGLLPDLSQVLTSDENFAIQYYFGFHGYSLTMREIGQHLNKSRKAVSYLINKALVKIKHEPEIEAYFFNSDKTEYVFSTYVSNESDEN